MNLNDFHLKMYAFWRDADAEAASLKDSYRAAERLESFYRALDLADRGLADAVLAEWVLADDERLRFDALTLVDDFVIASAIPALHQLAIRLSSAGTPGASYEMKRVQGTIERLSRVP